jgi:hypothetical protein
MSDSAPRKKATWPTWVITVLVAGAFAGLRFYRPGGVTSIATDAVTESSMSPELTRLGVRILTSLKPIGAAAICLKESGDNPALRRAALEYNRRNKRAMERLLKEVTAAGGLTSSQKDLLDRQAYREARTLVGTGAAQEAACRSLPQRLNGGEWDLDSLPSH